ncbi:hypothetical protein ACF3MZ_23885 [Paenibacillaceae bacterium WGS1546]|uniref:hypothetical protein n=1 Tax=Cohnella sp. WGS1546 TaxID=3366810 RepID=UPI00372D2440
MKKLTKTPFDKLSTLEETTQKICPAQDYINDTLIYGYLESSSKQWMFMTGTYRLKRDVLFEDEARKEFKFQELRKSAPIQGLSPEIMKKCFASKTVAQTKFLMNELREYIAQFIYLDNPRLYTLLATWIMSTYHFKGFTHFPYLWLHAEKGSGKSTLLNLLSKLTFNGLLIDAASSTSAQYRMIEMASPTLLIDEFEMMDKTIDTDLNKILRSGFYMDGKITKNKKQKDDFEPELISVYSPKALASISDIQDTLKERCITIRMFKKPKSEARRKFNPREEQMQIQYLKEKLYRYGLMHAPEIIAKYAGKSTNMVLPDHISDREQDLWLPLVTVTFHIDLEHETTFTDELLEVIDTSSDQRKYENVLNHDATKVIIALHRLVTTTSPDHVDGETQWYCNDTIYRFFNEKENRELTKYMSRVTLGKKLANLNLQQETINRGKARRYYSISSEIVQHLAERFDIPNEYLNM